LPTALAVQGQAQDLPHGRGPRREPLGFLGLLDRGGGVTPLEQFDRARQARDRVLLIARPGGPAYFLQHIGRQLGVGGFRALRGAGLAWFEWLGHRVSAYGKNENGPPEGGPFSTMFRRRPTLPPSHPGSTIGAGGLHFRVRDGTGCFPSAMATETVLPIVADPTWLRMRPSSRARELR